MEPSEMCSNVFKMPIKSVGMQNKYTLSCYKLLMVVFKQFSKKYFSGMPDWNVIYISECVLYSWDGWDKGNTSLAVEWVKAD